MLWCLSKLSGGNAITPLLKSVPTGHWPMHEAPQDTDNCAWRDLPLTETWHDQNSPMHAARRLTCRISSSASLAIALFMHDRISQAMELDLLTTTTKQHPYSCTIQCHLHYDISWCALHQCCYCASTILFTPQAI